MTPKTTLIAAALALTLSACGGNNPPATDTTATPPATEPAPTEPAPPSTMPAPASTATMPAPAGTTAMPAASTTPAGGEKPAAVVSDCATTIEGNDAIQYNVGSITVPATCAKFTITLKHVGKMPVAAMGHNVVVSKAADVQGIAADGMKAGASAGYLPANDARVIAHTKTIGGGETTSVSFDTSKIKDGGPYEFFCSFAGHAATMKGTISVG